MKVKLRTVQDLMDNEGFMFEPNGCFCNEDYNLSIDGVHCLGTEVEGTWDDIFVQETIPENKSIKLISTSKIGDVEAVDVVVLASSVDVTSFGRSYRIKDNNGCSFLVKENVSIRLIKMI